MASITLYAFLEKLVKEEHFQDLQLKKTLLNVIELLKINEKRIDVDKKYDEFFAFSDDQFINPIFDLLTNLIANKSIGLVTVTLDDDQKLELVKALVFIGQYATYIYYKKNKNVRRHDKKYKGS